jgi:predicted CxxxxCH...CXXCH cytochrome family protein
VPAALGDPGHIDQPRAVVFPDGTSTLARANGATPSWDAARGQCSNVWCHGATTPSWSGPPATCGTCHGVPPADAAHASASGLGSCVRCHSASIDATGQLLAPPAGKHLDGVVDAS